MARSLGIASLKLIGLAALLYVASFYLRLGYFLLAVYACGTVAALAMTAPQWKSAGHSVVAAAGTAGAYLVLQTAVFAMMTTESQEEFTMVWRQGSGPTSSSRQEIVLEFERFPGHYVGLYSDQVADYLASTGDDRVNVRFSVTRDLGCVRGFHESRIGSLTSWEVGAGGYSGSSGVDGSPWLDPWWCP